MLWSICRLCIINMGFCSVISSLSTQIYLSSVLTDTGVNTFTDLETGEELNSNLYGSFLVLIGHLYPY